ncbi:MAG: DNA polymerase III subunit delta [Candidatus Staskawiczbacteria bacterium RIFOXYC1_FULL_37_43]|nr:MAG: DNA polymerase III subunit delta [Candidatus Moranbacteria bacterium RIFOXYB12_FULL_35_8]OGZ64284.1 MAG: DNA polymerase III subunit delta [Candidatus Staskawiczbacteria bacterium RIFCSPHIGHO2_01_FULL_37_17]OGZ71610.1 MAG: DNA polymerase III subunit delta [Candidatus Staskawiczbacteria bacterium RIFCSPLOWO2_01_FULL_37_19]OGZ76364.1 MAG: DNA polymerase III subunit delta [Candidatus Staskawiczbacteria bacterium RIFOXYA1_FULL_37_15]OGZ77369.1 MAG: DNA polymerase III subunit delta [Candidatu
MSSQDFLSFFVLIITQKIENKESELKDCIITKKCFNQTIQSYLGVLKHCNSYKIKENVFNKFLGMIIFLYGEDSYRSKEKLNEIIGHYKKVHKSGLNLIFIDAIEKTFNDFFDSLKIVSMFAEKKLVVVKNVFSAKGGPAPGWQEEFLKEVNNFKNIKDIIVIYENDKVDERPKLFKQLKTHAKCQEFNLLQPAMLKKWIDKEFEKYGSKIDLPAKDLLSAYTGDDLWKMANEIKKLANYKREGIVKKEDVELHIRPKIENDIFKTIDAISQKNKGQAVGLLHKHLDNGDAPLYMLSMIAYQFKNLLIIKELAEKEAGYQAIVKKSGLHPFVVQKNYYLCQRFTSSQLKKIYQKIFQADSDIKTGKIDPELALDMLVAEI